MINFDNLELPKLEHLTRKEIQAIELREFSTYSTAFELMQRAGIAVAEFIKDNFTEESKITFCLGPGNNGGDGYIAASKLQGQYNIVIIRADDPKTEAATKAASKLDMDPSKIITPEEDIAGILENSDLIVDSIFGIGLQSTPRPPYDLWLETIANSSSPILSVDLPSGIDCNREYWYGPKFNPKYVITMQYTKAVMKNWDLEAQIEIMDIGFHKDTEYVLSDAHVKTFWNQRKPVSHKGQNGRVMVIGGSDEFTGAPVLSGCAILRSGVDTLRIAVPESIRDIVAGYNQDFIVVKTPGERHNSKSFKRFRNLTKNRHDVVVMGMGLSNHKETRKFVREIVDFLEDHVRIVLDADAIRPFKNNIEKLTDRKVIITPHKAELRHLLNSKIPESFDELVPFVIDIAKKYNMIILLKGEVDIITDGDRVLLNDTGNAAMTVGGTGDVLAGIVAAVNCFVEDKMYATAIAAYIMGRAGDMTYEELGIGLMASDIVERIPGILKELEIGIEQ